MMILDTILAVSCLYDRLMYGFFYGVVILSRAIAPNRTNRVTFLFLFAHPFYISSKVTTCMICRLFLPPPPPPPPRYAPSFYREKAVALSYLVDSHRIAPTHAARRSQQLIPFPLYVKSKLISPTQGKIRTPEPNSMNSS